MTFRTTPEQAQRIPFIISEMRSAGVDPELVTKAEAWAPTDQGVFDLLALWVGADPSEQGRILLDLKRSIDDITVPF